jgi:hypothetical protein
VFAASGTDFLGTGLDVEWFAGQAPARWIATRCTASQRTPDFDADPEDADGYLSARLAWTGNWFALGGNYLASGVSHDRTGSSD